MDVEEAIYGRRSVRAYDGRRVDEPTVDELLRSAVQAPSAMNAQPLVFAVVQNDAKLHAWSHEVRRYVRQHLPSTAEALHEDVFHGATTLVVIGAKERGPFVEADGWLAAENLMLTAYDLGLGTCCVGLALPVLRAPHAMSELGIPEQGIAIAAIVVGYPKEQPAAVARRAPEVTKWLR